MVWTEELSAHALHAWTVVRRDYGKRQTYHQNLSGFQLNKNLTHLAYAKDVIFVTQSISSAVMKCNIRRASETTFLSKTLQIVDYLLHQHCAVRIIYHGKLINSASLLVSMAFYLFTWKQLHFNTIKINCLDCRLNYTKLVCVCVCVCVCVFIKPTTYISFYICSLQKLAFCKWTL